MLLQQSPPVYKGFELHALVYPRNKKNHRAFTKSDEGYDAAVRICRPGAEQASANSSVFRVSRIWPFDGAGEARLACSAHAKRIIDGEIPGQSVEGL
jgi:hypothetical protein